MRRGPILVVVGFALFGLAVGLLILRSETPRNKVVGAISWQLSGVSADARTLTITHDIPHCETKPGRPVVEESATTVRITVPEVRTETGLAFRFGSGEFVCTADERFGSEPVRLRTAVGTRTLLQASRADPTKGGNTFLAPSRPGSEECDRLSRLGAKAPARDVPWIARRLAICTAPLPAEALALPILARPRTTDDRLPKRFDDDVRLRLILLHRENARRIKAGAAVWLIPGPEQSCVGRIRDGQASVTACERTRTIARRGWFLPETCVARTPTSISVVGIAPAGVDQVRFTPRGGSVRIVPVRAGGFGARVGYPFTARLGERRFASDYDFRTCW